MSSRPVRILTGIKPSGMPHLGNYAGAIRPALASARSRHAENFYFLADLHSLVNTHDPLRVQRATLEIAATWLACGLDAQHNWFYRQSDIPEIAELNWLLTCMAGKGLLNRAHAYKAAVDKNRAEGEDEDAGVSAGLFMYPVLMAADILIFSAERVPVGRDQVQHIEMARDFAQRFNHVYGGEYFVLPEAVIDENVATLPGLDGRKMSKSYDNTIPLFAPSQALKKAVFSIRTDSRAPGEAKDTDGSALFQLYQAFASAEETAAMRQAFAEGIGWADAKAKLYQRLEQEIAPQREKYQALVAQPQVLEDLLQDNASRLRERYAKPLLARLRDAVGLRPLTAAVADVAAVQAKPAAAVFKQFRERDGKFYFKLVLGDTLLLQSRGFDSPKEAGQCVAALKAGELDGLGRDYQLAEGVDKATLTAQLAALA